MKRTKRGYEVKANLRLEFPSKVKRYVVKKRFDRKELVGLIKTGQSNHWNLTVTQMRSILNLTSPKDWWYRYVDKDPGLGGDRS